MFQNNSVDVIYHIIAFRERPYNTVNKRRVSQGGRRVNNFSEGCVIPTEYNDEPFGGEPLCCTDLKRSATSNIPLSCAIHWYLHLVDYN